MLECGADLIKKCIILSEKAVQNNILIYSYKEHMARYLYPLKINIVSTVQV